MGLILGQYSDKFMYSIVLYSVVLRRAQLYCIVNLFKCYVDIVQYINLSEYWTTLVGLGFKRNKTKC